MVSKPIVASALLAMLLYPGCAKAKQRSIDPMNTRETVAILLQQNPFMYCWANKDIITEHEIINEGSWRDISITWQELPGGRLEIHRLTIDKEMCKGTVNGIVNLNIYLKVFPDEELEETAEQCEQKKCQISS